MELKRVVGISQVFISIFFLDLNVLLWCPNTPWDWHCSHGIFSDQVDFQGRDPHGFVRFVPV